MSSNRLEKFTVKKISREQLKGAQYNPRKISKSAAKKLRDSLRSYGMLQPIVWNQRTGNIVGGHQRVDAMDTLLKKKDYELTVAVVDLEEQEEVKASIVMNNPSVMGEWNTDLLAEIKIDFPEIDFDTDLGFDRYDIDLIFADTELEEDIFQEQKPVKDEIEKMREIDAIKQAKKEHREKSKMENESGESHQIEKDDYMVTFVFPNNDEKWDFMRRIREKTSERYVKHTKLYDIQDGTLIAYGGVVE